MGYGRGRGKVLLVGCGGVFVEERGRREPLLGRRGGNTAEGGLIYTDWRKHL